MQRMIGGFLAGAAGVGMAISAAPALAEYPEEPIRMIVVYAPGGSSDVVTRILARHLEDELGQSVVVQNISGGGGAVGWQQAMNAEPDGYTLTMFADSLPVMEATGSVDYTIGDFETVAVWGTMDLTIFAQKDRYESLDAYVAEAEANPGEVGLAMGYGTPSQFVAKVVEEALGVDLNLVNVGGGADKKAAVLGGHVEAGIEPMPGMAEPSRAGQFDVLAILGDERIEDLPDIPTAKELGYDAVAFNTYGVLAPKGTPEDRLERIDQAIAAISDDEAFIEANREVNFDVRYMPRDEATEHLQGVRQRTLEIGKRLGF